MKGEKAAKGEKCFYEFYLPSKTRSLRTKLHSIDRHDVNFLPLWEKRETNKQKKKTNKKRLSAGKDIPGLKVNTS